MNNYPFIKPTVLLKNEDSFLYFELKNLKMEKIHFEKINELIDELLKNSYIDDRKETLYDKIKAYVENLCDKFQEEKKKCKLLLEDPNISEFSKSVISNGLESISRVEEIKNKFKLLDIYKFKNEVYIDFHEENNKIFIKFNDFVIDALNLSACKAECTLYKSNFFDPDIYKVSISKLFET